MGKNISKSQPENQDAGVEPVGPVVSGGYVNTRNGFNNEERVFMESVRHPGSFIQAVCGDTVRRSKGNNRCCLWKVTRVSGSNYEVYLESVAFPGKYMSASNQAISSCAKKVKTRAHQGEREKFRFEDLSRDEYHVVTSVDSWLDAKNDGGITHSIPPNCTVGPKFRITLQPKNRK